MPELHPHWVGDHSKCPPGLSACAEEDAKIAERRRNPLNQELEALLDEAHDRIGEPPSGPPLTAQDIRDSANRLRAARADNPDHH